MSGFLTEEAIQFLVQYYPIIPQKKPALFHSVRVASYMYINGYSEDLCVAGLLHDAIEDTPITKEMIAEKYSYYIADIVEANSKNLSLPKEEILEDIVQRCSQYGQDAMIIKIIEVYDNYLFYTRQIQE
ncbi:MAG: HD domain-containing protein [Patescibacteria group bacterium]|nr:HD domain-containing protein [Patescibacteria group bacterium]